MELGVLIRGNALIGALVTSFHTAGIGYLISEMSSLSPDRAMMSVGFGVVSGAIASLALGWYADRIGTQELLVIVQVFPAASYLFLGLFSWELLPSISPRYSRHRRW
ncbi:hypothetical protein GP475_10340 [Corynebacterium poyangense]|uniref:Uncharacterized protein n=1 Tax=Corynebacterium poyangense TaxID=2684405 RepID=A0A7H0SR10_9CORY|nr:hypothetical protein [Corynebacterium poyangense]QNQ90985.1 hypothetical protein GP475_10340 [Corynebacterium poyangense]